MREIKKYFFVLLGSVALSFASASHAKQTIKIAFIGPLTGSLADQGIGARNSAELAVKLQNKDPDSKYKYKLSAFDSECKPNVGVGVATRVASNNQYVAGVTNYCSVVAIASIRFYHRFNFPVVIWAAALPKITYGNNYKDINRVAGIMIGEDKLAAKSLTSRGYSRFVIIHDITDYGKAHEKYYSTFVKKYGGKVIGSFGVTPDQQDFTSIMLKAQALHPQVIYFGGLEGPAVRIRNEMEKLNIRALYEVTSGDITQAFLDSLGTYANGVVAFAPYPPIRELPGGKRFLNQYDTAGYKEPPGLYGPYAYAATSLIIHTVERVGPSRKAITSALRAANIKDSVIGQIKFDKHGQNVTAPYTSYVVQDQKWKTWKSADYHRRARQSSK